MPAIGLVRIGMNAVDDDLLAIAKNFNFVNLAIQVFEIASLSF